MAQKYPPGQLLSAPITNGSSTSQFGTHIDYLGVGGYRTVENIATRDAIVSKDVLEFDEQSSGMRRNLMLVSVASEEKLYVLHIPNYNSLSSTQRLAALKDNTHWQLLSDFLSQSNSSGSVIYELDEFIATQDGVQLISLPVAAAGVFDINVLETSGGVRPIYQKAYMVNNGILIISAIANVVSGDRICGSYYITNNVSVPTPSEIIMILDVQGDDGLSIASVTSS